MTKLKFTGALEADTREAIEHITEEAFANPGARYMAIVELGVVKQIALGTAAADNEEPSVMIRATQIELFSKEREDVARNTLEALHMERTSAGTLDEGSAEGQTLKHLRGLATIADPTEPAKQTAD